MTEQAGRLPFPEVTEQAGRLLCASEAIVMRLLLFSDLHGDLDACRRLVDRSRDVDVAIAAGDFGSARRGVNRCVDALKPIEIPTVLVPGNNESLEELVAACHGWSSATVLHGTSTSIAGVSFFGLGGGVPVTPFGPWSYDFTEEEAARLLTDCPTGGVLVTHSPPRGSVDTDSAGRSLGSVTVRATIEQKRPVLVVCGHIHPSAGQQAKIGDSVIINAGPAGMLWDVP